MTYLLLMRHGAHEDGSDAAGAPRRVLTADAKAQIGEVAGALEEFIAETYSLPEHRLAPSQIWHATTEEATQTAAILHERLARLRDVTQVQKERLSPRQTSPYGPTGNQAELIDDITTFLRAAQSDTALIVVGHQPLLGWIAATFAGEAYPIQRAELLCLYFAEGIRRRRWWQPHRLAVGRRAVLRWVLTPGDVSGVIDELKEKIRGKMEGAKLLGAFSTAILSFILGTLIDTKKLADLGQGRFLIFAAALTFLVATLLYFASYYAYDRLLMPIRFWGEPPLRTWSRHPNWLVMRPPSSAAWVLYQNMMHVWSGLFTPAVVLVCIGLTFLGLAVLQPQPLIGAVVAIVALAILFRPLYRILGPRLGSQD
jgi:phosphohistidine phosphatase SixA